MQSFYENRKVLFRKNWYFENFYGSLLELSLSMKDCQGSYNKFFVSQDFSSYIYIESPTYFYFLVPIRNYYSKLFSPAQTLMF